MIILNRHQFSFSVDFLNVLSFVSVVILSTADRATLLPCEE